MTSTQKKMPGGPDGVLAFSSLVSGARRRPAGEPLALVDPANGREWARAFIDPDVADEAVESARTAFSDPSWADLSGPERGRLLRQFGDLITANAEELGKLESLANGKPHTATIGEMRATAQWYHYYASVIETRDDRRREVSRSVEASIVREPLGVVVAITPFNGALSLGSWKIAPALAAGNTAILKPPPDAPASSIRLAELSVEAGIPEGVVNVVIGDTAIAERLVTHDDVAMVSFTGSTAVARRLGAEVGGRMKRYVCEAGGKSAHIIFEDADIESAVIAATQGAFAASGQTCVAGSRILLHESIRDAFLERYVESVRRLRLGDPKSPTTHIGPVASRRQLDRILNYVHGAVAEGARVLVGGELPVMEDDLADGFWFAPTVLVDVTAGMTICREEVFGPVVTIQSFADEDEAVMLANGVDYGLAAGFWTRDISRVRRVSRRLQVGTVWVNTYRAINLRVPFGGYKQSGIGRENGAEALDEFTQIKSVVVDYAPAVDPFAH